ncbi:nucleoside triphosphate pyrophosphohydrolase [Marinilactibacillus kalidii]|uniref:nucleoside triphosphate pyrophosphohydrolase n=1 Tax=Marinilactibacillus kalidii TaxID=2820274 RepID=UPI001ABE5608|nr:nucleoside triphosphate pyrophosphohydrolase [Marinilactibacillus kalidii]
MERYDKLVRDRIPEMIQENGEACTVKRLRGKDYTEALKGKLKEEVKEYLLATDSTSCLEELADILEVLHGLANIHHVSFDTIEQLREEKEKERGGFKERIFLISKAK